MTWTRHGHLSAAALSETSRTMKKSPTLSCSEHCLVLLLPKNPAHCRACFSLYSLCSYCTCLIAALINVSSHFLHPSRRSPYNCLITSVFFAFVSLHCSHLSYCTFYVLLDLARILNHVLYCNCWCHALIEICSTTIAHHPSHYHHLHLLLRHPLAKYQMMPHQDQAFPP